MAFAQFFKADLFTLDGPAKTFGQLVKAERSNLFAELVNQEFIEKVVVNIRAGNKASSFQVTIRDPGFRLLDRADVVFRDSFMRIDAGGFGAGNHRTIIPYGMVTDIQPEYGTKDYPILVVTGHDESTVLANLNDGAKRHEGTLFDVVSNIAAGKGFSVEFLDPTRQQQRPVALMQAADVSDRQVLDELSRKLGYIFYVRGGVVRFIKVVKNIKTSQPIMPTSNQFYWRMGEKSNLRKVIIRVRKRQGNKFGVPFGQFPNQGALNLLDKGLRDTAKAIEGAARSLVDLEPVLTENPATGDVPHIFKNASYTLEGDLVAGDVDFLPGENCDIGGLGKVYSGLWRVMSVKHAWGEDGFQTSFVGHKGDLPGWDTLDPADIENAEHVQ